MKLSTELEMQNSSPKCKSHEVESIASVIQEHNKLMKESLERVNLDAEKNDDDSASVEGKDVGSESPQEEYFH